ncbi:DUF2786 domain-containing protein [Lachnospiraceae bacterium 62-35]
MDTNAIKRKIERLLALSKSDNENEALAAVQAARKLMLKYHITMSAGEWRKETAREGETLYTSSQVVTKELRFKSIRPKRHHLLLAAILAKNFRCKTFYDNRKVFCIRFIGLEEDAYAVLMLMEYLVRFMEQGVKAYRGREEQEYSWREGFCKGVLETFEIQNRDEPGYEVMLAIPKEVKEAYERLKLKKISRSGQRKYVPLDGEAFFHGESSGKKAVNGRRISPQE